MRRWEEDLGLAVLIYWVKEKEEERKVEIR